MVTRREINRFLKQEFGGGVREPIAIVLAFVLLGLVGCCVAADRAAERFMNCDSYDCGEDH